MLTRSFCCRDRLSTVTCDRSTGAVSAIDQFDVEATNFASYSAFSLGRKLPLRAVALILALLR